jgi:hypothetical protein
VAGVFTPQDKAIMPLIEFQAPRAGRAFGSEGKETWAIGDLAADYPQDTAHGVGDLGGTAFQAADPAGDIGDLVLQPFQFRSQG